MATGSMNLPEGFELDQEPAQPANVNLPPGFELDNGPQQAAQPPSAKSGFTEMMKQSAAATPLGGIINATGKVVDLASKPILQMPQSVKDLASKVTSVTTRPARALGVLATTGTNIPFVPTTTTPTSIVSGIQQAKEAYQPGYVPKTPAQSIGSSLGEMGALGALSMVPGGQILAPAAMIASDIEKTGGITPMDVAAGAGTAANLGTKLFRSSGLADRVLPPLLKATKGVPTNVTKMAIQDPSILDLPGTSESIQGKSQDIINAINQAKTKTGAGLGAAYSEQGMKSPVDRIIESGQPTKIPFEQLRNDYQTAMNGELLNGLSDRQKLATLTDLKRSLQDQAIYPQPGQQLSPSEGSFNAAVKKMASDIDNLRGTIPGGDKLAMADDAYVEMKDLAHRLMNDFRDPYKGQDYLNRILKGNTDWLTSGRNAGKMGAIERIEQITGRQVLQPALKEMAAAYLNNPDVMGLPSFGLKSILTALIPTKTILRGGLGLSGSPVSGFENALSEVNPAVNEAAASQKRNTGQVPTAIFAVPGNAPAPKPLLKKMPKPLQAAELPQQDQNDQLAMARTPDRPSPIQTIIGSTRGEMEQPEKILDEKTARAYLKQAGGNKQLARHMAQNDGWTVV